jgi:ABC-2 type transport system permease protein
MRKVLVLARRELGGYFFSPIAYVLGAIFLAACAGVFFWGMPLANVPRIFAPGSEASLRSLFEVVAYALIGVVPLLTMRQISEEYRSGTIELLLTAPVTDAEVIGGKFLGAMGFLLSLLATTLVFLVLMVLYGRPDLGVVVMGYLGTILLGSACVAVGLFASTLTPHQLLAAGVSITILAGFVLLMHALTLLAPAPLNYLAARLNAMIYFRDFARGIFDTRGLVYYLSATALFLFLSVKTLESRRWR